MCWSQGIPVRQVDGDSDILGFHPKGHVWCEVFAPISNKEYIIIPVDAAQGYFNEVNGKFHISLPFLPRVKNLQGEYSPEPFEMKVSII